MFKNSKHTNPFGFTRLRVYNSLTKWTGSARSAVGAQPPTASSLFRIDFDLITPRIFSREPRRIFGFKIWYDLSMLLGCRYLLPIGRAIKSANCRPARFAFLSAQWNLMVLRFLAGFVGCRCVTSGCSSQSGFTLR